MKKIYPKSLWIVLLLSFYLLGQSSCARRYLAHCKHKGKKIYHQHLLISNAVVIKGEKGYTITEDKDNLGYELGSVIQQKPNQKILWFRPRMWAYIGADTLKRKHRLYCDNTGQYAAAPQYPQRKRGKLGRWFLKKVGEKPVILDTAIAQRTVNSMRYYLNHKGYYNAEVAYKIRYKRHKAYLSYEARPGKRLLIDSVFFECPDTTLLAYIQGIPPKAHPVRANEPLDRLVFDQEKVFLTEYIRNQGYFKFSSTYIAFEADTVNARRVAPIEKKMWEFLMPGMQGEPRANIYVKIFPYMDTIPTHPRYKIRNVFIQPDENIVFASQNRQFARDTLYVVEYLNKRDKQPRRKVIPEARFLTEGDSVVQKILFIKKRMRSFSAPFLARMFTLRANEYYNYNLYKENFRRMTEIDVFKAPRIDYLPSMSQQADELDCFVRFRPAYPHVLGADAEINNNNANLGGSVNLNYRNRNIFRGGESFVFKVESSVDFKLNDTTQRQNTVDQTLAKWINLLDINAETSLYFPRFVGWSSASLWSTIQAPTTRITIGYRYLQQSDVFRVSTFSARYGYQWNNGKKHQFVVNPVQLNFALRPILDPAFEQRLAFTNRVLLASLKEQFFIPSGDFTYTYNNPDVQGNHTFYLKTYTEFAGNSLRLLNLVQETPFKIFGSDYSQYAKVDIDFRYSYKWTRKTSIVTRLLLGAALPFGETANRGLPFSRRFFMGGPSSMRAWRIRHLGPGRIAAVPGAEFQQGDIRIEWNLEYRQKLNSWIALAVFSDMGNIWLWKPETTQTVFIPSRRPETGVFTKDFYREMAVALGLGLRLDFSFFIFRIDFAMQFYNPSGYRLLNNGRVQYFNYNPLATGLSNWVIGVGYPF